MLERIQKKQRKRDIIYLNVGQKKKEQTGSLLFSLIRKNIEPTSFRIVLSIFVKQPVSRELNKAKVYNIC